MLQNRMEDAVVVDAKIRKVKNVGLFVYTKTIHWQPHI